MAAKVLIAEDDRSISALVASVLELEGYDVLAVPDGSSVLPALEGFPADIAILDVMMPGQDGIAVLKQIRSSEQHGRMPVIVLTAKSDAESTWAGWQAGCDYYIPKPFDPEHVIETVARLLAETQSGVSA